MSRADHARRERSCRGLTSRVRRAAAGVASSVPAFLLRLPRAASLLAPLALLLAALALAAPEIHADNGGVPGSALALMKNPGARLTGSFAPYKFTSNFELTANTTYWVTINFTGSDPQEHSISGTSSDFEDAGALPGRSTGNHRLWRHVTPLVERQHQHERPADEPCRLWERHHGAGTAERQSEQRRDEAESSGPPGESIRAPAKSIGSAATATIRLGAAGCRAHATRAQPRRFGGMWKWEAGQA